MVNILHVTQCYDGGVSRAMDNISKLLPEITHHILYDGKENPSLSGNYSKIEKFSKNPLLRAAEVRSFVKKIDADIIHAHSSWAGLYTRILHHSVPVVYEPHCFVFDDPRRHPLLRRVYRTIEILLSKRTSITVALTKHEHRLAKSLNEASEVRILPNIPTIPTVSHRNSLALDNLVITMIGRIAAQKDPQFFADLAKLASGRGLPFRFVWIGAGSIEATSLLEDAGVEVTGWLTPMEISNRLENTWLYLHSARYEGFPLSVLDAAAARVPIIVRDLPCFDDTKLVKIGSPSDALRALELALLDKNFFEETQNGGRLLLQTMNVETHTEVIRSVYMEAKRLSPNSMTGIPS